MKNVWGKAFGIAGLILMLGGTLSWGAPPNNDESDALGNTAGGSGALQNNTTGSANTASGHAALSGNTTGFNNTASGHAAPSGNTTGSNNTASGSNADVSAGNLVNATAIGAGSLVNASNKSRLGNTADTVIEGQVAFTSNSDKTKKENFRPVDGEAVLAKMRGLALTSWNFIGHDPEAFRVSPQKSVAESPCSSRLPRGGK